MSKLITLNGNEKRYLLHELLRHLGLFIFYAFGALLFYEITGSIAAAFILGLVYFGSSVISLFLFIPLFLKIKDVIGVVGVMGIGLGIVAAVNAAFFMVSDIGPVSLAVLIGLLIISSFGSGMYWVFSNIIKLKNVGNSSKPASYSSYLVIARIIAAVIASFVGIVLSFQDHFSILFVISSVLLFISLVPLFGMTDINHKETFRLRRVFRKVPLLTLAANFRIIPEMTNYGIPLFFLLTFMSLPKSVFVTGVSLMVAAALSYLVGRYKDHGNNALIIISFFLAVVGFLAFTQATSIVTFIIIVSILGVSKKALRVGSSARLGREIVARDNALEFMFGLEIMRNLGSVVALALMLALFLIFNDLPQWMFALGVIFIIPEALYSAGFLEKK